MWPPRVLGVLLCLVGFCWIPTSASAAHPAPIPEARGAIPLGSALWYACTDAQYAGPAPLQCVVPGHDPRYAATYMRNFDRFTPENEFKMLWTEPERGKFDFSVTDAIVRFARANGKAIRGHTLIYAAANAGWVESTRWTPETLLAAMRTHVDTLVSRYAGDVREWDVVNEPFLSTGARDPNVYQQTIGQDWIEQAFRAADAADPSALLFLNEFAADVRGPRQQALLALAKDFVSRGVPLDGIGLEMHVGADGTYPTQAELAEVMADYAALGLRVEITEADALRPADPALDATLVQRAAYDTIARACQQAPNCTGMSVWGVADSYSWRGAGQTATLFTASFNQKRAYDLVRCRLADPKPANGPWTPTDCGTTPSVPPATTTPTGPTDGSSTGSNAAQVPAPTPAPAPLAPRVITSTPAPRPATTAPTRIAPTARLVRARPTRAQLARGITTRVTGARSRAAITVRVRRGTRLLATTTRRAAADGTASLTTRLPAGVRRTLVRRGTLRVTVSFTGDDGRRTVRTLRLTIS